MNTHKFINGSEIAISSTDPENALINFYHAFNNKNIELMKSNWLQTNEASMSNPLGGVKRGWDEIRHVYQKIFKGHADVFVEFYDFTVHETENMFFAVGRERGVLKENGTEIQLAIRTSRIYQKINNQWKHIHHHGSMDNPELLANYQNIILKK
jgi:ketosteroid isomerase-like protein